jgi:hypothetical protein
MPRRHRLRRTGPGKGGTRTRCAARRGRQRRRPAPCGRRGHSGARSWHAKRPRPAAGWSWCADQRAETRWTGHRSQRRRSSVPTRAEKGPVGGMTAGRERREARTGCTRLTTTLDAVRSAAHFLLLSAVPFARPNMVHGTVTARSPVRRSAVVVTRGKYTSWENPFEQVPLQVVKLDECLSPTMAKLYKCGHTLMARAGGRLASRGEPQGACGCTLMARIKFHWNLFPHMEFSNCHAVLHLIHRQVASRPKGCGEAGRNDAIPRSLRLSDVSGPRRNPSTAMVGPIHLEPCDRQHRRRGAG